MRQRLTATSNLNVLGLIVFSQVCYWLGIALGALAW